MGNTKHNTFVNERFVNTLYACHLYLAITIYTFKLTLAERRAAAARGHDNRYRKDQRPRVQYTDSRYHDGVHMGYNVARPQSISTSEHIV